MQRAERAERAEPSPDLQDEVCMLTPAIRTFQAVYGVIYLRIFKLRLPLPDSRDWRVGC